MWNKIVKRFYKAQLRCLELDNHTNPIGGMIVSAYNGGKPQTKTPLCIFPCMVCSGYSDKLSSKPPSEICFAPIWSFFGTGQAGQAAPVK
jgi:hypothetical protein